MKKILYMMLIFMMSFATGAKAAPDVYHTGSVLNHGRAIVLMYHLVSNSSEEWSDYCISPAKLERDIQTLLAGGYTFIGTDGLRGDGSREQKYVMLTFDDGYASDYTLVYPLLKKYKVPAVFFLVGSYIGRPEYLAKEQIAEMAQSSYVEFGNHSYSVHDKTAKQVTKLCEKIDAVVEDYQKNDKILTALTGRKITALSYPYGICTRPIDAGIKDKLTDIITFTTQPERFDFPYTGRPVGRVNRANSVNLPDLLKLIHME